jgi:hypothetical protein
VLGYHGCDRETGERLLRNEPFRKSENKWDWLGSGIYFWEANPDRAWEWAQELESDRKAEGQDFEPFVVGAVIDTGFCLDLISSNGSRLVEEAYGSFCAVVQASGAILPENTGRGLRNRKLDCAVINYIHTVREQSEKPSFDTVRGLFPEGDELYPNSGFRRQTHIQICVRNPTNIHGVFRVAQRYFSEPAPSFSILS